MIFKKDSMSWNQFRLLKMLFNETDLTSGLTTDKMVIDYFKKVASEYDETQEILDNEILQLRYDYNIYSALEHIKDTNKVSDLLREEDDFSLEIAIIFTVEHELINLFEELGDNNE